MNIAWLIYLTGIVDTVKQISKITCVLLGVTLLFIYFLLYLEISDGIVCDEINDTFTHVKNKAWKSLFPIWIIASLLAIFVPTSKQIIAMVIIPKVVDNKQVQKLPDNVLDLLNNKCQEWTKNSIDKQNDEGHK